MSPMSDLTSLPSSDMDDTPSDVPTEPESEDDDVVIIQMAPAQPSPPVNAPIGALAALLAANAAAPIPAAVTSVAAAPAVVTAPQAPVHAPPQAISGPYGYLIMDPMVTDVGVSFGVVPAGDLVVLPGWGVMAKKFYAVSYGHFVGVFCDHDTMNMAIGGVSCAGYFSSKDCNHVVEWFNNRRRMGLVRIV
ncbi:hypothetical protein BD626DRAFT_573571 [Schizophyllum amplum]|uniref:Uncharacterized protein n=1 Tax=Schizophyllum amplum TaxID=97359 RepID=A0A550C0L7_9AGAR|nr:hypothetical protein BD626DRAFT_573571 [Auriculariopsis ampla]